MRPLSNITSQLCFAAILSAFCVRAEATEHIVEIVNFAFSPRQLSVESGDTITWVNRDVVSHNVSGGTVNTWRSPNLRKDETFSLVITSDLNYLCSLHVASMKGQIVIENK